MNRSARLKKVIDEIEPGVPFPRNGRLRVLNQRGARSARSARRGGSVMGHSGGLSGAGGHLQSPLVEDVRVSGHRVCGGGARCVVVVGFVVFWVGVVVVAFQFFSK
ncbi:MAG: hypothetical protein RR888_09440 [Akkermansia sp.]